MVGHSPQLPPKKEVALALLEGPSVYVHLDPRRQGVSVPSWFKKQPQLILQIGMNMAVPIPDLEVREDGIGCTLSFNRAPYWVFMPYNAIYGLVCEDGRGMIWPDDVPPELAEQQRRPSLKAVPSGGSPAPRNKRVHKRVPASAEAEGDGVEAADEELSEDAGLEDAQSAGSDAGSDAGGADSGAPNRPRPVLRAVPDSSEPPDSLPADEDEQGSSGRAADAADPEVVVERSSKLPSYLRVIK